MALLTTQPTSRTPGVDISAAALVAADAGLSDKWANTGRELLIVNNGSGAPITLTFNIVGQIDGQTPAGPTATVAAGKTRIFGPFPQNAYNTTLNQASVSYSAVTSVLVGVVQPTQS
jgi:hypothetical protein